MGALLQLFHIDINMFKPPAAQQQRRVLYEQKQSIPPSPRQQHQQQQDQERSAAVLIVSFSSHSRSPLVNADKRRKWKCVRCSSFKKKRNEFSNQQINVQLNTLGWDHSQSRTSMKVYLFFVLNSFLLKSTIKFFKSKVYLWKNHFCCSLLFV